MTGHHYDLTGERVEDDDATETPAVRTPPGTRDEIHRQRCAELRAVLAAARARREGDR